MPKDNIVSETNKGSATEVIIWTSKIRRIWLWKSCKTENIIRDPSTIISFISYNFLRILYNFYY